MRIGIAGCGMVGTALKNGFEHLGYEVLISDPKLNLNYRNILDTEAVFICVPTNETKSGACDTSIVWTVVRELISAYYDGIIVIKSTVPPGTTELIAKEFSCADIAFVPEFLRERCATEDFINNQDLLVIGCNNKAVSAKIAAIHHPLPKRVTWCSPSEAEAVKYFNNVYNATLITFANSFFEVCKALEVDYTKVKNIATLRTHINDVYLDCNENMRGFGGYCLPKDTSCIANLARLLKTGVKFFHHILVENAKYKTTVFKGMRP
jgi:UDPglucose 6-dehydrogenase